MYHVRYRTKRGYYGYIQCTSLTMVNDLVADTLREGGYITAIAKRGKRMETPELPQQRKEVSNAS